MKYFCLKTKSDKRKAGDISLPSKMDTLSIITEFNNREKKWLDSSSEKTDQFQNARMGRKEYFAIVEILLMAKKMRNENKLAFIWKQDSNVSIKKKKNLYERSQKITYIN